MTSSVPSANSPFDELSFGPANKVALSPVRFLDRSARTFPEKIAVIDGERVITYRQLKARSTQLAHALLQSGIRRNDVVSIIAPNTLPMIEAHFGVPMAGAVLNTINTRLDPEAVIAILRHAGSRFLLIDRNFIALLAAVRVAADLSVRIVEIDSGGGASYEEFLTMGDPEAVLPEIDNEDLALALNYTSGTTGSPKGVVYSHRGAALNALGNALSLQLNARSNYLWTLPLFHCNGWTHVWSVVATGGTQVCLRRVEAADIFRSIGQHNVTHLAGAPVVLGLLVNAPDQHRRKFDQEVIVATGGAAPPSSVIKSMEDMGFSVTHLYGLTETYGPSMICEIQEQWRDAPLEERARWISRQGVPHPLVGDVSVRDPETMTPMPWDGHSIGEIMVRGNTVMKGYLKNPQATAEVFKNGWFRTGDLGVTHPDGYVEVKDRIKDIIITGGENVSSLEIEEVLYQHPCVMEAAVVARPDPKWGETPIAFISPKPGTPIPDPETLIAFCRERLAGFKVPKHFVFGRLPKTSTGKIQKNVLRDKVRASADKAVGK